MDQIWPKRIFPVGNLCMYPWSLLTILNFFMWWPTDATVFNVSSSSRRDNKRTVPLRGSVAAGNYETFSFSITDSPQSWSYFTRNLPCEISRKKAVISPSFLARHSNHKLTILTLITLIKLIKCGSGEVGGITECNLS